MNDRPLREPTEPAPPLHPDLAPLAALVGSWSGAGDGEYPTIEAFGYLEQIEFSHGIKPFLIYTQRTWAADDARPLHAETGYLRMPAPGRIEWVVAHPTGMAEIGEGTVEPSETGMRIEISSTSVALTATAKEVTAVRRVFRLAGDRLDYELEMAAVGQPLTHHLAASLERRSNA